MTLDEIIEVTHEKLAEPKPSKAAIKAALGIDHEDMFRFTDEESAKAAMQFVSSVAEMQAA